MKQQAGCSAGGIEKKLTAQSKGGERAGTAAWVLSGCLLEVQAAAHQISQLQACVSTSCPGEPTECGAALSMAQSAAARFSHSHP